MTEDGDAQHRDACDSNGVQVVSGQEKEHSCTEDPQSTAGEEVMTQEQSATQTDPPGKGGGRRRRDVLKKRWKQCFSPALTCIRRAKLNKMSAKHKPECGDITFCNMQNSGGSPGEDSGGENFENNLAVAPSETRGAFRKLLTTSICSSQSKGKHSAKIQPRTLSLKNKLACLLKQKSKKPSPFFQEHLAGTQDFTEEENIVLSNKCAEGASLSPSPDRHMERSALCSETVTVSAEVTHIICEGNLPESSPTVVVHEGEEDHAKEALKYITNSESLLSVDEAQKDCQVPVENLRQDPSKGADSGFPVSNCRGSEMGSVDIMEENISNMVSGVEEQFKDSHPVERCQIPLIVVGSPSREVLLVKTACALVQAVMKTALDKLEEELKEQAASLRKGTEEIQHQA